MPMVDIVESSNSLKQSATRGWSPDSQRNWTEPGAWKVQDGIYRIPLPLPLDGLAAVNVYLIETSEGPVLIDGGWAIQEARDTLERCLGSLGFGFADIHRFLVTHAHRDHFTLATVLGREYGTDVALGADERPALELVHDMELEDNPFFDLLVTAGAREIADRWTAKVAKPEREDWTFPTGWLEGDHQIDLSGRTVEALHTPGHTPGHFVFAERETGLLFSGDHVLPNITPSIGFTVPAPPLPLRDFIDSLVKVRSLPDLFLLPAHGPIGASSHARVDQLLTFHEDRLVLCLEALARGPSTSHQIAQELGWTRHSRNYSELDLFGQGMASLETKAHLELLVARGSATRTAHSDGVIFRAKANLRS